MIRLRDDLGWTMTGMGLIMAASIVLVFAALVGVAWLTWPKDSRGNPLPCVHSHTETIVVMAGKVPVIETVEECDTWASPSPG